MKNVSRISNREFNDLVDRGLTRAHAERSAVFHGLVSRAMRLLHVG